MAQSNRDYWRKREEEARRHEIKDEEEYRKRLAEIYRYTQSNIEKEINGFYARYAAKNGITMAEARKRASKADMEDLARKAAKYVAEKDFSDQANEEMALYNLTMKANRLEMLKANIGLELIDGFNDVEKEIRADLTETALKEYARMAGILGASVRGSEKHARVLVNASFRNATFSERVWASQSVLKSSLERLLTVGIIQGRNPNVLMTEVVKAMKVSEYEARRLLVTEMCRLQTEVQKESYERNGYKQYIIITCGEDACEECQKMDGRVFFVKDMAPGDNAPPFHPSCRCSTAEFADRGRLEDLIGQVEKERGEGNETGAEAGEEKAKEIEIKDLLKKIDMNMSVSVEDFTYNEMRALSEYVSFRSYEINDKLRRSVNESLLSEDDHIFVRNLDTALTKNDNYKGVVYRSIDIQLMDEDAFNKQHQVGNVIITDAYTSASKHVYDPDMKYQFVIISKRGKDISWYNTDEEEVLFRRGTCFVITDRIGNTIYMEEV